MFPKCCVRDKSNGNESNLIIYNLKCLRKDKKSLISATELSRSLEEAPLVRSIKVSNDSEFLVEKKKSGEYLAAKVVSLDQVINLGKSSEDVAPYYALLGKQADS